MIKNILFDLDGTMLPMDQELFIKAYFGALCEKFCPILKIKPEELIKGIWKGTEAMIKNDGSAPNLEKFWHNFAKTCGKDILNYIRDFDEFYQNEFIAVKSVCGYNPAVPETINTLKRKGYNLIAATNPIFPSVATNERLRWAGLSYTDFSYITTYDNSSFCKPNSKYYEEIFHKLNILPEECFMVGNDIDEDILPTLDLGLDCYVVTDNLINKRETDISKIKSGTFKDFLSFARMLPDVR